MNLQSALSIVALQQNKKLSTLYTSREQMSYWSAESSKILSQNDHMYVGMPTHQTLDGNSKPIIVSLITLDGNSKPNATAERGLLLTPVLLEHYSI